MDNVTNTRAVVLGGIIAGLFAARVLADAYDEVVIVDRDRLVGIAKLAESDEGEEEPQAALPGADKPGPAPAGGKAGKKGETDFLGDDEDED